MRPPTVGSGACDFPGPNDRGVANPDRIGRHAAREHGLDAAAEIVDRLGGRRDGLERSVLAPASDLRDRLTAHVQASAGAGQICRRVNDHLGSFAAVFDVSDAERVDRLVDQDAQPGVGGLVGVDDDSADVPTAPAPGRGLGATRSRP